MISHVLLLHMLEIHIYISKICLGIPGYNPDSSRNRNACHIKTRQNSEYDPGKYAALYISTSAMAVLYRVTVPCRCVLESNNGV